MKLSESPFGSPCFWRQAEGKLLMWELYLQTIDSKNSPPPRMNGKERTIPEVVVIYSQCCPVCVETRDFWRGLKGELEFDYQEVEVAAEHGTDWILKYSIHSVPSTVINEKVAFVGMPDAHAARALIAGGSLQTGGL